MKNRERIFKKYLAKREVIREGFCNLHLTTDVKKANVFTYKIIGYIYAAGGWIFQLLHSWLSVAFPGISFPLTSKRQPQ
jgi:hypothetical protein